MLRHSESDNPPTQEDTRRLWQLAVWIEGSLGRDVGSIYEYGALGEGQSGGWRRDNTVLHPTARNQSRPSSSALNRRGPRVSASVGLKEQ